MKNKSKKPSVGSMVNDSIGMMITGGFGGTHAYGGGAAVIASKKSKDLGGKGSKKRIGSKVF